VVKLGGMCIGGEAKGVSKQRWTSCSDFGRVLQVNLSFSPYAIASYSENI
jgi:hypothetical protein